MRPELVEGRFWLTRIITAVNIVYCSLATRGIKMNLNGKWIVFATTAGESEPASSAARALTRHGASVALVDKLSEVWPVALRVPENTDVPDLIILDADEMPLETSLGLPQHLSWIPKQFPDSGFAGALYSHALREAPKPPPVILITRHSWPVIMQRLRRHTQASIQHPSLHVAKPFTVQQLLELIKSL